MQEGIFNEFSLEKGRNVRRYANMKSWRYLQF